MFDQGRVQQLDRGLLDGLSDGARWRSTRWTWWWRTSDTHVGFGCIAARVANPAPGNSSRPSTVMGCSDPWAGMGRPVAMQPWSRSPVSCRRMGWIAARGSAAKSCASRSWGGRKERITASANNAGWGNGPQPRSKLQRSISSPWRIKSGCQQNLHQGGYCGDCTRESTPAKLPCALIHCRRTWHTPTRHSASDATACPCRWSAAGSSGSVSAPRPAIDRHHARHASSRPSRWR